MLGCMHVCGFCHMFFLVRCRKNFWRSWNLGQTHDSNDENAQWRSNRTVLRGTFEIQINGVMASYCSCSKGLSSDFMELPTGRITHSLHNTLLASAMKVTLQNISNLLLRGNVCLKIPGPFKSTLLTNPGQHDGLHLRATSWGVAAWLPSWWSSRHPAVLEAWQILVLLVARVGHNRCFSNFWASCHCRFVASDGQQVEGFHGILRINK